MGGSGNGLGNAEHVSGDDALLVRRAQASPREFEPLYLRYRTPILGYCYRRLRDRDDAEDAASAIFVAALRGLRTFNDRGRGDAFRTWLFTIAHNEIAGRHRWRSRHPEEPLAATNTMLDPDRSPEDTALIADDQRRLAMLLADLPPRERETIELRLADLKTSEIARVLGISEESVRSAQARAVAKLRRLMMPTNAIRREAVDA